MSYIPKSKINILDTIGGEFVFRDNNKSQNLLIPEDYYVGPYIETSKGLFYAGNNPNNLSRPLKRPESGDDVFGPSEDVSLFNQIKTPIFNKFKKTKSINGTKNIPSEQDYRKGWYFRYFAKKVNEDFSYIEIDNKSYTSILKKSVAYDTNLYKVGKVKWSLEGNVFKINRMSLKRLERKFPFIMTLFPLLNEFKSVDLQVQENLTTNGSELYYEDGTEYIGFYHIHPDKGPMVGPKHSEDPHAKLYYSKPSITGIKSKMDSLDAGFEAYKKAQSEIKHKANVSENIQHEELQELNITRSETPASKPTTSTTTSTPPPTPTGPSAPSPGVSGY